MSYQMVNRVHDHCSDVKGPAKAVLVNLAHHDFGNPDWVTDQALLADETGLSRATVQRALDSLILAKKIKRTHKNGIRNHYELLIECPETCLRVRQHRQDPPQSEAGPASERGSIKASERSSSSKKKKSSDGAPEATPRPLPLVAQQVLEREQALGHIGSPDWIARANACRTDSQANKLEEQWSKIGRYDLYLREVGGYTAEELMFG
jgi:hypothetical protein